VEVFDRVEAVYRVLIVSSGEVVFCPGHIYVARLASLNNYCRPYLVVLKSGFLALFSRLVGSVFPPDRFALWNFESL
jgi:hypothetical protein